MPLLFDCVMLFGLRPAARFLYGPPLPAVLWREEKLREINVDARTEPLRSGGVG